MSKCHLKGCPDVVPELIRLTKKQVSFLLPGAQSSLAKLNLELVHPQEAHVTAGSGFMLSFAKQRSAVFKGRSVLRDSAGTARKG